MVISPALASSSPQIRRSSVLLPQPDGPTKTTNSPSATARSTPWITRLLSKSLTRPCNCSDAIYLTPAEAMPWAMYFCKKANTSVTGSSVMTVIASR